MPLKSFEKHPLSKEWLDATKDFDCNGSEVSNFKKINTFLKEECLKYNHDNYSKTNIYIQDKKCKAFYSLAMGSIELPRNKEEKYLFSWDEIPGNDSGAFIDFLKKNFCINWVKGENIQKDGNIVSVLDGEKSISLILNDERIKASRASLKIKDINTNVVTDIDEFMVRTENNKLNIYEENYIALRDYPALFLTHLAVDKRYQHKGIAKAILNDIIKQAYENKEIAARFIFLDAYRESVSWYLKNFLFEIMYVPLSERIEKYCERYIIEKLNHRLEQGHTIECGLSQTKDISSIKKNCETILIKHVNDIFKDLAPEKSLLKTCDSKVKLTFENNKPEIKLERFTTRENLRLIREWLQDKDNVLNIDVTIPLYADINKYYIAIHGS